MSDYELRLWSLNVSHGKKLITLYAQGYNHVHARRKMARTWLNQPNVPSFDPKEKFVTDRYREDGSVETNVPFDTMENAIAEGHLFRSLHGVIIEITDPDHE